MGQANLAGLRHRTAAGKPLGRYRVVGTAKRSVADQPRAAGQCPGNGIDLGGLDLLLKGHFRQNRRQPLGQHRLAGARRADHQAIVSTGSCDLQRPLGVLLPLYICKVQVLQRVLLRGKCPVARLYQYLALQVIQHLAHMGHRQHIYALHYAALVPVGSGNKHRVQPFFPGAQHHGQHPGAGPDFAVQRQLA